MTDQPHDDSDDTLAVRLRGLILDSSPGLRDRLEVDPAATLELISLAQSAQTATDEILSEAVGAARAAQHSWSTIGEALATSRQAAQQRFGAAALGGAQEPSTTTKQLFGLTALNEMSRLNEAGRHGWHSVGFGAMFHTVENSDVQWEHLRLTVGVGAPGEGWARIGMWFPWVYYARPTRRPALPEPESVISAR